MEVRDEHLIQKNLTGREKAEWKRMHGRTLEQFKDDIRQAHIDEKEIIYRYAQHHKDKTGKDLHIVDNGVDNTGEFLDVADVRADADFIVNGKATEVKTIKKNLQKFRLKLNLLKSYLRQDADVILVIGWETDSPEFTILKKKELEQIVKYGIREISGDWEGKPSVYIYKSSLKWHPLPHIKS